MTEHPHPVFRDPSPTQKTALRQLRWISDLMLAWRVCGKRKCLRARACRGHYFQCMARAAPLVPHGAREFVTGLIAAKDEGRSFEYACKKYRGFLDAYNDWTIAVDASLGPQNHAIDKAANRPTAAAVRRAVTR